MGPLERKNYAVQDIMRSDGRVHGALVTNLRQDTRVVCVEWFEKGETKGKEIDLGALKKNNPHLFQQPPPLPQPTSGVVASALEAKVAAVAARLPIQKALGAEQPTQLVTTRRVRDGGASKINDTFCSNNNANDKRRSMVGAVKAPAAVGVDSVATDASGPKKANITKIPPIVRPRAAQPPLGIADQPPAAEDFIEHQTDVIFEEPLPPHTAPSSTQPAVAVPKSQVVSKIEEIEKGRADRRAQQSEAKKQKEIQKNIDPGNPNWQFLSMIRDYQAQVDYRPLKMTDGVVENRICVCVRRRPLNTKELGRKEIEVITIPNRDHVIVHQPQVKVDLTKYLDNQKFRFDYTFDENSTNEMVYKFTAQPLVKTIFARGFATCFAYGQTGSGKTHTMGGTLDGKVQNCANGIYALTAMDVFKIMHSSEYRNENLVASCSFFEIYGAKVFDLLGKKAKLRVLEDGKKLVQVVGLKEIRVQNADDVLKLIRQGSEQRTAGQTSANSNSSRSHAVFQIILRRRDSNHADSLYGKFSLIDLAGNERGADTISSDRQTRLEGAEINKSLLALKECIRAMGRDVQHVPFRGSKLTLILRDSFVGKNAKTCMIAMISPGMSCVENTMNTLRYADRVKELGNENGHTSNSPMTDDELLVGGGDEMDIMNYEESRALKVLRNRNADSMNEAAYKYQMAVENMNRAEERAIDEQQFLFEKLQISVDQIAKLLEQTNDVQYDMEDHTNRSIKTTCEIITAASKCKVAFERLSERIVEEQEMSGRQGGGSRK